MDEADKKTGAASIYPDPETFFSRDYVVNNGPPLHSDAYMQQQLSQLSSPAPQQNFFPAQKQASLTQRNFAVPAPAGPIHPSMIPRNQQVPSGVAGSSGNVAAPMNMYNYKPSGPAPVVPAISGTSGASGAPAPRSPRARQGDNMLFFPNSNGNNNNTHSDDAESAHAVSVIVAQEITAPPLPPRVSHHEISSPLVFNPARSGDLLFPAAPEVASGASGNAAPPPVPPRSPMLQKKMAEELTGNVDLLDFQRKESNLLSLNFAETSNSNHLNSNISNISNNVDDWEIDESDLFFEREIASGTFGSVWRGEFRRTPAAIKKLHGSKLTERQMTEFRQEVGIMKKLRHPNVVLFLGYSTNKKTGDPMYMVFEYLERGSLWGIIHDKRTYISQPLRVKFAQDIARGLYYLHSLRPPVLHRDVKSPNILADSALCLKVADFGLSKTRQCLAETMTSGMGTYQYMAPEVIQGTDYSLKADVFSYGIVLWEILARLPPYQNIPGMTLAFKVVNEGLRPTIPPHSDASYAQLMQACWATNPDLRPSFGFILDALQTMQGPEPVKR